MLTGINKTNAAIMVAFGICNSALAMKKQFVKGLKERFEAQKIELQQFKAKRDAGEIGRDVPFEFQADLQTFQVPALPMDILQALAFEKLALSGRSLSLVTTLIQTIGGLSGSIENRNELISGYKAESFDSRQLVPLYFGLPYGGGHVNLDYPATLDAISRLTDDIIFFAQLLCNDLREHGEGVRAKFKAKFGKVAPTVRVVDFKQASDAGLMPNETNYVDWINAFKKPEASGSGKERRKWIWRRAH